MCFKNHQQISKELGNLNSLQTYQLNPLFHTWKDLVNGWWERDKALIAWCLFTYQSTGMVLG